MVNMMYSDEQCRSWLRQCYYEAVKSPDPSTQIGSAFILGNQLQPDTLAFNGPTRYWDMTQDQWDNKSLKYQLVEHAERRALYKAAKNGLWTEGGALVSTWAACADCARAMAECGIKTLIRHYPPLDDATERWLESISIGDQILKANNVAIINIIGNIESVPGVLRSGEMFYPDGLPCQELSAVE